MPDFETAIVKLRSSQVLYEAEGYDSKGIGNASKGHAPVNNWVPVKSIAMPQVVQQAVNQAPQALRRSERIAALPVQPSYKGMF